MLADPKRFAILLCCILALTPVRPAAAADSPLPPDPSDWVCASTPPEMPAEQWCSEVRQRRASADLGVAPAPMSDVDGKNAYDAALKDFLVGHRYREGGLDWYGDQTWRLTGPIVGPLPAGGAFEGKSYGVHPAVRIYYSPEVIDWLCAGRQGVIAAGGMIVKEMRNLADTPISAPDQCMEIDTGGDLEPQSWAVMVRTEGVTVDGWYWGNPNTAMPDPTKPCMDGVAFPKLLDASAITDAGFWNADCPQVDPPPPAQRLPSWYPTGLGAGRWSQVYPWSGFSAYCVNCHASAASELTYSSLDNVLSPGLRYKNFPLATASAAPLTPLRPSVSRHDPTMMARRLAAPEGDAATGPYPTPLPAPRSQFLSFFGDALAPASYADAWSLRLPSETRDHYGAKPDRAGDFLTSDQCIGCHDATLSNDATPNMVLATKDGSQINVSPYAEWRASPMGLAGRDPIFFSQLESETLTLPELADCIENTCLHCHGVMGQRQFAADNPGGADAPCTSDIFAVAPPAGVPFAKEPYRRAWLGEWQSDEPHNEYAALSRDGISCTVCHRITAESLKNGESGYTGNFVTADSPEIYGPFADDTIVTKPMDHALGRLPVEGSQITDSGLCNSCHNILLPVFDNDGKPAVTKGPDGTPLTAKYEQTTGLEWTNSQFSSGATFQSCQDCHMPDTFHGSDIPPTKIANIEDNGFAPTTDRLPDEEIELTARDNFTRHALHGLNIFLNQMFQQFPMILGLRQLDYMNSTPQPALITGAESMLEMATEQTATVSITDLEVSAKQLAATVLVENDVGHFLPSGVGFRRVFLEFVVRAAANDDEILFASGMTNDLGAIVDLSAATCADATDPNTCTTVAGEDFYASTTAYQPHYQTITRTDQAQIYQELIKDSAGNLTTSFLRRVDDVKDNRLRSRGYDPAVFAKDPSPYVKELAMLHGEAAKDPYYSDPKLTGADEIAFVVPLDGRKPGRVEVTLYSQSIPPFYLQQRFANGELAEEPSGNADIRRLFYLTSHLNTDFVGPDGAPSPVAGWKLELTSACQQADGSACTERPNATPAP